MRLRSHLRSDLGFHLRPRLLGVQVRLLHPARGDRGQGTLEYVGMIAVAATLVIAILQATRTVDLAGFFTSAIRSVTGSGGGGGGADSGGG